MRRTQLYLEEDLWAALHARALLEGVTISELVRTAARERYMADHVARRAAMLEMVGLWQNRQELGDTEAFIRNLRNDNRLARINRPEGE